jgi:hypothetical protein
VKLREVVGGGKVDGSRIKATHWPCNISHTKQRRRRRRRKEEAAAAAAAQERVKRVGINDAASSFSFL